MKLFIKVYKLYSMQCVYFTLTSISQNNPLYKIILVSPPVPLSYEPHDNEALNRFVHGANSMGDVNKNPSIFNFHRYKI